MRVRVYRNLHKDCFSVQVKTKNGWRVRHHLKNITLNNVTFHVRESGRQKVLKEKRKNVHAWLEGDMFRDFLHLYWPKGRQIRYNPYEAGYFRLGSKPIYSTDRVILDYPNLYKVQVNGQE